MTAGIALLTLPFDRGRVSGGRKSGLAGDRNPSLCTNAIVSLNRVAQPLTPKTSRSLLLTCLRGLSRRQPDDGSFRYIPMASDIFAKIGDIKGESLDAKHKDEIEVLSFSWGVTMAATASPGSGGGTGKATFQDLSVVHTIDKASPKLLEACATGAHIKEATITHRKAGKGQQEYLIFKMNDVIVTGVVHGGASGGAESETVSLAFAKVDLEYRPIKADGSLDAGVRFKFDIKANKVG
jgi:type VI secretion system secreted protein Hcp